MIRTVVRSIAAVAALTALATAAPRAAGPLKVVATTPDLGALATEIGGDKVKVNSLALGTQDPHFVDPKPSFMALLSAADVILVVGRELEIGWLPPLQSGSRNAKVQVGGSGYLDVSQHVK